MYGLLMNQDPVKDETFQKKIHNGLAEFDRLANKEGPFFLGATLSLADVLLIPMWDQFRFILPHYRNFELIPDDTSKAPWVPRLQKWAAAVEKLDAFHEIRMDKQRYVTGYAGYAGARGASKPKD